MNKVVAVSERTQTNSESQNQSRLWVISGPSGVGKGTLCKKLLNDISNLVWSVSATSRPPREDEVDGKDYVFLSKEEFQARIEANAFLEWAEYNDNYYGTLKAPVQRWLASGQSVLLEIDVQGALAVKDCEPNASLIFIAPPSVDTLKERLSIRGTNTEADIASRLDIAEKELHQQDYFERVLVNENLDEAFTTLKTWMTAS